MRYGLATIVFAAALVLLSGCGNNYDHENVAAAEQENIEDTEEDSSPVISNESDKNEEAKNDAVQKEAEESVSDDDFSITGVEISFDFSRMSTKASNQIAAWIEDENGNIVKTIYVSDFAGARRGYKKREDAIPHWVAAADPDALSDEEIDAVSSATLQTGSQSFEWDLTDDEGNTVPAGKYTVKLEGTLFWSSNVVYSSIVDTENDSPGEIEVQEERSEPDDHDNETMIQNVRMTERGNDNDQ